MKPLNYIENQLFRVFPAPILNESEMDIKVKLYSRFGQSNWLNITPAQLREIEQILNPEPTTE
jgi:hypothetical protein